MKFETSLLKVLLFIMFLNATVITDQNDHHSKQNEELSLKLADKSSELTRLIGQRSAGDEKMFERSQGVLSKLEVLHKNLINNRTGWLNY